MADARFAMTGMAELLRATAMAENEVGKDVRAALQSAAEPVRSDAELLAKQAIRPGRVPWSSMRTGITRTSVYVAPVQRGVKSRTNPRRRRPAFKHYLLDEAMEPALEQNTDKIVREVEDAFDDLARRWEGM